MDIENLHRRIKAVAPIDGVSAPDPADKSTWRVDFKDEATQEERDAAQAVIDAFDQNAAHVPTWITPMQGKRQLFAMGLMTADEVLTGARPAFLQAVIDQLVNNGQDAAAATIVLRWENAVEWRRADPLFSDGLLTAAAQALGQPATPELVDQFFRDAGALT